ncbi:MAG TPA: 4-hydroxy-3-methylbut-2-enyl diphosphate reductase, partial [Chthoniobacteraceae bacterium]|nr:4-hydroxy-3-methylbut-2-enyl diphosphate reductase [Chthoniobacteraceae bacterium]
HDKVTKPRMIIKLAQHFGLCFGVRDAINEAERLATHAPLTILGELVHNPVVQEELRQRGVRHASLDDVGAANTPQVMITAHGASDRAREAWRKAGFGVADGTCPLVRHAHDQLKLLVDLGYFPIVIGKPGHVEVAGLTGDFPGAVVIEGMSDLGRIPRAPRLGIISQTTQPIIHVQELVGAIREMHPLSEVRFIDTVCQPTKRRQSALAALLSECDTIVVVGGRHSNNTLELVRSARAAGRRVHHVQSASELDPTWFTGNETVGITAGTSTLHETVAAVQRRLETIAGEFAAEAADDRQVAK